MPVYWAGTAGLAASLLGWPVGAAPDCAAASAPLVGAALPLAAALPLVALGSVDGVLEASLLAAPAGAAESDALDPFLLRWRLCAFSLVELASLAEVSVGAGVVAVCAGALGSLGAVVVASCAAAGRAVRPSTASETRAILRMVPSPSVLVVHGEDRASGRCAENGCVH